MIVMTDKITKYIFKILRDSKPVKYQPGMPEIVTELFKQAVIKSLDNCKICSKPYDKEVLKNHKHMALFSHTTKAQQEGYCSEYCEYKAKLRGISE